MLNGSGVTALEKPWLQPKHKLGAAVCTSAAPATNGFSGVRKHPDTVRFDAQLEDETRVRRGKWNAPASSVRAPFGSISTLRSCGAAHGSPSRDRALPAIVLDFDPRQPVSLSECVFQTVVDRRASRDHQCKRGYGQQSDTQCTSRVVVSGCFRLSASITTWQNAHVGDHE
jgi:hypothetical protein